MKNGPINHHLQVPNTSFGQKILLIVWWRELLATTCSL